MESLSDCSSCQTSRAGLLCRHNDSTSAAAKAELVGDAGVGAVIRGVSVLGHGVRDQLEVVPVAVALLPSNLRHTRLCAGETFYFCLSQIKVEFDVSSLQLQSIIQSTSNFTSWLNLQPKSVNFFCDLDTNIFFHQKIISTDP